MELGSSYHEIVQIQSRPCIIPWSPCFTDSELSGSASPKMSLKGRFRSSWASFMCHKSPKSGANFMAPTIGKFLVLCRQTSTQQFPDSGEIHFHIKKPRGKQGKIMKSWAVKSVSDLRIDLLPIPFRTHDSKSRLPPVSSEHCANGSRPAKWLRTSSVCPPIRGTEPKLTSQNTKFWKKVYNEFMKFI